MYEELNCFEEALKHFGTRVEFTIAMEMSRRISPEEAYQIIKTELKDLKKIRKKSKTDPEFGYEWTPLPSDKNKN